MNKHEPALKAEAAPDFFTGIGLAVDQIDDDVRNDLPKLLRRIVTAHRSKDAIVLKLACEAYAKHLGNMEGVANLVVRQCLVHLNRKPRA